jgi:hypothetical protein
MLRARRRTYRFDYVAKHMISLMDEHEPAEHDQLTHEILSDFNKLLELVVTSSVSRLYNYFLDDYNELINYVILYIDEVWKDKLYSSHLNYVERTSKNIIHEHSN